MNKPLTLTALQSDLVWEDKTKNLAAFERALTTLLPTDLVILPEMFTTGFTMAAQKFAESMDGTTVQWMQHWAKKLDAAVAGSTIITDNGTTYNRFLFVSPEGSVQFYDKRHTFTLAGEHKAYTQGQNDGLIVYKGWKICLRVCYDLRFPVWGRNTSDYDLLLYTANWPHKRISAWDTLLKARAIENMSYCVGVNRIGTDGSNLEYPGHTAVYDFMGKTIGQTTPNKAGHCQVILTKEDQELARKKLNFLNDRDHFTIQ
ncbi:MAG: amidohydrolase [Flavobacteriaceae bacterium]